MTDHVIYLRNPFPLPIDVTEPMVRDASQLLEIDESVFDRLVGSLSSFDGFMDQQKLTELLARLLADESRAARVVAFMQSFWRAYGRSSERVQRFADDISNWLSENDESGEIVATRQRDTLHSRIRGALTSYPCLLRQAKAENLSTTIGNPLEKLELICDVRPVFDKAKENIEGMIPLTWLHIVAKQADGLPKAFEVVLSEQDLSVMEDAVQQARKKLKHIRKVVTADLGKSVPKTDLTL
ncbi:MAG: hypothetical protein DWQ31_14775 [Planctomycetota bacterium]|nr:MAG: hypothetical protein DWQ31_14775 [Planctomycetota bacterium]REJ90785.1 MAG: hypothetical protein DWQ35_15720 [Planctomycetota bacterium]REK23889.1 MAG: hypothetical protein DWQ42_14205 [Planctomycetota bacterium]